MNEFQLDYKRYQKLLKNETIRKNVCSSLKKIFEDYTNENNYENNALLLFITKISLLLIDDDFKSINKEIDAYFSIRKSVIKKTQIAPTPLDQKIHISVYSECENIKIILNSYLY